MLEAEQRAHSKAVGWLSSWFILLIISSCMGEYGVSSVNSNLFLEEYSQFCCLLYIDRSSFTINSMLWLERLHSDIQTMTSTVIGKLAKLSRTIDECVFQTAHRKWKSPQTHIKLTFVQNEYLWYDSNNKSLIVCAQHTYNEPTIMKLDIIYF